MSSEYKGSIEDSKTQPQQNAPSPQQPVPPVQNQAKPVEQARGYSERPELEGYREPDYREHVSGPLPMHPGSGRYYPPQQPGGYSPQPGYPQQPGYPPQQPGYPQQPAYPQWQPGYSQQPPRYPQQQPGYPPGANQGYPGYPPPYAYAPYGYPAYGYHPGYGYPPYAAYPQPAKPKRDTYLFVISILSFIGGIVAILCGILSVFLILFTSLIESDSTRIKASQIFSTQVEFSAFAVAGIVGGSIVLYHAIRSLFYKKPSKEFKLPWFWIFLIGYGVFLAIDYGLTAANLEIANFPITFILILLTGIAPALTLLALAVRRVHFPRNAHWPTTWRRVVTSLITGMTSAILFATIIELVLTIAAALAFHVSNANVFNLDDPSSSMPNGEIGFLLVLLAVIAPLTEELVKPLAVVTIIRRINGPAEAFILGLSCGLGFYLVETIGYIGMGYTDWVSVALERTSAGLLHGLGAGMVALGWYFITHRGSTGRYNRALVAIGCWLYAVLQHGIWNGQQVWPWLSSGQFSIGSLTLPVFLIFYIVESALMLAFLLYVTGRLRQKPDTTAPKTTSTPETVPSNLQQAHVG